MPAQAVGEQELVVDRRRAHPAREVGAQQRQQVGIVRQLGGEQLALQVHLGVRQHHGQLGPREGVPLLLALEQLLGGGKELEPPVQESRALEQEERVAELARHVPGPPLVQADRQALRVVVRQDVRRHVLGHLPEQAVPRLPVDPAARDRPVQEDLQVHLVVRHVHTGRVVQRVRVAAPAGERVLDAGELRQPQVPPLAHHPDAELPGVHAHVVVPGIAHPAVRLTARLHVRADPPVPQEVRRRAEDRPDERVRVHLPLLDAQAVAGLGRELDPLRRALPDAAAGAQHGAVVVVPGRRRELEQPLALGEARLRVGVGIHEDVPVVEGDDEADLAAEQHAVAEHVPAHVTDPDHAHRLRGRIHAQLPEVALHAGPGAARRDAQLLVVVPLRAAGGERVVQPETALGGDPVRVVGQAGGPLVRGDDQVGVRAVPHDRVLGVTEPPVDHVVGDVQQPADERLVALHPGPARRLRVGRRALHDVGPLRPGRDDHRVLHLLRLDEAEHLPPKVLAPVAPADPPARHLAHPQVRRLGERPAQVDLVPGPGARHDLDRTAVELERQQGIRLLARRLEVVRPQGGLDELEHPPVGAVVLDPAHTAQRLVELDDQPLHGGPAPLLGRRVQQRLEDPEEQPRHPRVLHQGPLAPEAARHRAGPEGVARVRPQDGHLTPLEPGGEDERAQAIIVRPVRLHRPERLGHSRLGVRPVHLPFGRHLHLEGVDRAGQARAGGGDVVLVGLDHPEAEVLERGHDVAQHEHAARGEDLEPGGVRPAVRRGLHDHLLHAGVLERLEPLDVGHRRFHVHGGLVLGREIILVAVGQLVCALGLVAALQRVGEPLLPAPHRLAHARLQGAQVQLGHLVQVRVDVEVEPGLVPLAERQVVVQQAALVGRHQLLLDLLPHLAREAVLRQDHHHVHAAGERVGARRHPHLVGPGRLHHRVDDGGQLAGGGQEELLLRHAVEDLEDQVVVVGGLRGPFRLQDLPQLAAQDRDGGGVLLVRLGGEQSDETVLPPHLAARPEPLDADVVHAGAALDGGLRVRLGDDEEGAAEHPRPELRRQVLHRPRLPVAGAHVLPQDPEPGAPLHLDVLAALLVRHDLVAAVAQIDEAAVLQPAKELLDLLELGRPPGDLLDLLVQLRHDVAPALDHGREVRRHPPHEPEALPDLGLHAAAGPLLHGPLHRHEDDGGAAPVGRPVADPHDGAVPVPLQGEHGVEQVRDGEALGVHVLAQRVDDEGTVRHHRLHGREVPTFGEPADAHPDLLGLRVLDELEEAVHVLHRVLQGTPLQEIRGAADEEAARELGQDLGGDAEPPRVQRLDDLVELLPYEGGLFHRLGGSGRHEVAG